MSRKRRHTLRYVEHFANRHDAIDRTFGDAINFIDAPAGISCNRLIRIHLSESFSAKNIPEPQPSDRFISCTPLPMAALQPVSAFQGLTPAPQKQLPPASRHPRPLFLALRFATRILLPWQWFPKKPARLFNIYS
jgi:hypothetical protein